MNVGGRSCNFDRNFDRNSEDGRLQHQFWKRTSQHIVMITIVISSWAYLTTYNPAVSACLLH